MYEIFVIAQSIHARHRTIPNKPSSVRNHFIFGSQENSNKVISNYDFDFMQIPGMKKNHLMVFFCSKAG